MANCISSCIFTSSTVVPDFLVAGAYPYPMTWTNGTVQKAISYHQVTPSSNFENPWEYDLGINKVGGVFSDAFVDLFKTSSPSFLVSAKSLSEAPFNTAFKMSSIYEGSVWRRGEDV